MSIFLGLPVPFCCRGNNSRAHISNSYQLESYMNAFGQLLKTVFSQSSLCCLIYFRIWLKQHQCWEFLYFFTSCICIFPDFLHLNLKSHCWAFRSALSWTFMHWSSSPAELLPAARVSRWRRLIIVCLLCPWTEKLALSLRTIVLNSLRRRLILTHFLNQNLLFSCDRQGLHDCFFLK